MIQFFLSGIGNIVTCCAFSLLIAHFVTRRVSNENEYLREKNRLLMQRNINLKLERRAELLIGDGSLMGGTHIQTLVDIKVLFMEKDGVN